MSEPFKPCPFCGSANQMMLGPTCDRNTPYDPNDRAFPIVRCFGCITDVSGQDFDASGKTAIEAWNRRSDADAAAERDRLREACSCALGHLTGNMDGDIELGDPVELLRAALNPAGDA